MNEPSQGPLLQNAGGGLSCFYKNRRLYHPARPVEQAVLRARAVRTRPGTLYLLPSPLLWYGVPELLERIGPGSAVVAVEEDEHLMRLSLDHVPDRLASEPRLTFISFAEARDGVSLDCSPYRAVELVTLNGGFSLGADRYRALFSHLERRIRLQWQNRMTLAWFGPLWLKNLFCNCGHLASISPESRLRSPLAESTVRGRPVLIAGAGPSLDTALEGIRSVRERVFLLAVDTALAALESAGIHADGAICQDGQFYTLGDFSAVPAALERNIFLDLTSCRSLTRHLKGTLFPFVSRFDSIALFDRLASALPGIPVLPPVGSVGITALLAAELLSPSALLFAGLDFSYHLGKSHARGTPFHLREISSRNRFSPEGAFGTILARRPFPLDGERLPAVLHDVVLSGYAETFSERLSVSAGRGVPFYIFPGTLRGAGAGEAEVTSPGAFLDGLPASPSPPDRRTEAHTVREECFESDLRGFLENERRLLRRFLEGDLECWEDISYVYSYFPDFHRLGKEGPDRQFLNRSAVSAGRYLRILEQALTFPRS